MKRTLIHISILAGLIVALAAPGPLQLPTMQSAAIATPIPDSDSISEADTTRHEKTDSIWRSMRESLDTDSAAADTLENGRQRLSRINHDQTDLTTAVDFTATDSLILIGRNNAFLYGNSTVEYGEFKLNSAEIHMQMDSTTVYAQGALDSLGVLQNTPVFQDGGGEYESRTMKYNFKTQKGFITDVITQQGEGYLTGESTKKNDDGSFFIEGGRYTTCDNHEHPHFYFQLTRAKMRPKKDVVSGPVYMVLCDVPLPLALPFGYFPFTKDYSSGIIFPTFGDDYNRGFYLREGGYYFAINDYVDLALTGEIYTKGSWGVAGRSTYAKRYGFRGNLSFSYITTITGEKGLADYMKQNNFQLIWSHSQDTKANPNMNFSASVNFTTSGYTRNDLNSYYNSSFTENTKSSTVNLTYRIPNSKWNFSTTANISQRTQDSTLAVSFPNLNISMSQTSPFKRKKTMGGERWYEKIRMSYSGQFQNSLTARQDQFFKKNLVKDWRNGMKHSVPMSATFSAFKYFNISPAINLNDRMYTSKIRRSWDPNASAEVQDTTYGFYNLFDFNASLSLDTKLYGFFKPMKFLGDKVQMIRHVMTPTVSFSAAPDFGDPMWGAYGSYSYTDRSGRLQTRDYSYFQHGIFGTLGRGKTGMVSMSLANNLEMKVKSDKDTTGVKKISLIENLSLSQSYNFAADSLNWSNLSTGLMVRLVKNFNLNLNATWDPYTYRLSSSGTPVRVNVPRWKAGKGWVRLASAGTSFSYTFNNDTFRRKNTGNSTNTASSANDVDDDEDTDTEGDSFAQRAAARRNNNHDHEQGATTSDGYFDWKCPWSLSVNYSVNYGQADFDYTKMEYKGKFNQNLSFSGNIRPTTNWNFSFSASYNFDLHKIAYMNCSVSRDLHDFTMTCSIVPVGPYKSYNFHIAMKSSLLQDLKYDKRSSNKNGVDWY